MSFSVLLWFASPSPIYISFPLFLLFVFVNVFLYFPRYLDGTLCFSFYYAALKVFIKWWKSSEAVLFGSDCCANWLIPRQRDLIITEDVMLWARLRPLDLPYMLQLPSRDFSWHDRRSVEAVTDVLWRQIPEFNGGSLGAFMDWWDFIGLSTCTCLNLIPSHLPVTHYFHL